MLTVTHLSYYHSSPMRRRMTKTMIHGLRNLQGLERQGVWGDSLEVYRWLLDVNKVVVVRELGRTCRNFFMVGYIKIQRPKTRIGLIVERWMNGTGLAVVLWVPEQLIPS